MAVKFNVFKGQSNWRVSPPVTEASPGDDVQIKVVDPDAHGIKVVSDAFQNSPLQVNGKSVVAHIRGDVERHKYHEFQVYIDGQFAEANSAPGIIID